MKIVKRKSKLWKFWFLLWPGADPNHTLIAFGDHVFIPGDSIREDLVIHEAVHLEQQRHSYIFAVFWYIWYTLSPKFRLEKELEAYGEQIIFILDGANRKGRKSIKENNTINKMIEEVSVLMSGGMYGNVGSKEEIVLKLKKYIEENDRNFNKLS